MNKPASRYYNILLLVNIHAYHTLDPHSLPRIFIFVPTLAPTCDIQLWMSHYFAILANSNRINVEMAPLRHWMQLRGNIRRNLPWNFQFYMAPNVRLILWTFVCPLFMTSHEIYIDWTWYYPDRTILIICHRMMYTTYLVRQATPSTTTKIPMPNVTTMMITTNKPANKQNNNNVWLSRVTAHVSWDCHVWQSFLTVTCESQMWLSCVFVARDCHAWLSRVTVTRDCHVWLSCVTVMCDCHVWLMCYCNVWLLSRVTVTRDWLR